MYEEIRIVYSETELDEILKILKECDIKRYINYSNVQTKWSDNLRHLGNHTWPGVDSLMILILKQEKSEKLKEKLKLFKEKLKEGLDLFVIISPIKEII